jgi:tetratricopeptide (TPR) repeat protein
LRVEHRANRETKARTSAVPPGIIRAMRSGGTRTASVIGALVLAAIAVYLVGVVGSTAQAQDAGEGTSQQAADPSRDAEARGLFDAGRTAFEAGRYADALGYFTRAHELSARPALLFNIGSAHDRLRHDADALIAFEAYLRTVPDARNRAEVEARIALLREAVAERERERERAAAARVNEGDDTAERTPSAGPSSGGRLFTWVAGGLALASAAVATWAWVDANSRYSELEDGCYALRGMCTDAEIDDSGVATRVTLTNVFGVVALVALAGAVTLFFLEAPDAEDATAAHASIGVSIGRVELRGAF